MIILREFIINNFIKEIALSNSARKVYYKITDKKPLPKKYSDDSKYIFINEVLCDAITTEKIIKNIKTHGKPRFHKISGNDLWSGVDHFLRSKIGSETKKYFYEYFRNTAPIVDYPVGLSVTINDNLKGRMGGDIDNTAYIYIKAIQDALCGNVEFFKVIQPSDKTGKCKVSYMPDRIKYPAIIVDDSRDLINENRIRINYVDVPDEETSMIIQIYKTDA
jgi:hypothetical protein